MRLRLLIPVDVLAAAAVVLLTLTIAGAGSPEGSPTQVSSAVKASINLKSIPTDLTPGLASFANPTSAYKLLGPAFFGPCDAYKNTAEQTNPTPCVFGDTQSTKTIVLVGDSNVGNWAPALALGLKSAGYRLAVFGFAGCDTPDLTYTATNDPNTIPAQCNEWHRTVASAILAQHPLAVIGVSGPVGIPEINNSQWIAGFKKLFTNTTTPSTIRILFGTSPIFTDGAAQCLAIHSDPQSCDLRYSPSTYYGQYVARDPKIAAAVKATLIPVYPWMCYARDCSPVVGKYLTVGDTDHLTIAYSEYLATVVTEAVLKVITKSAA
jgi:hypothetical protein